MISHKYKFIYTRIPKTGSTSVSDTLEIALRDQAPYFKDPWYILDEIRTCRGPHWTPSSPITLFPPPCGTSSTLHAKDYFKFTFVRNPWARCVSKYFWHRQRKDEGAAFQEGNSTFAEFAKSKGPPYGPNDERKFYKPTTIKRTMQLEARGNVGRLLIHEQKYPWDNQLDWISDENGVVLTDFIGRLENFQEDFNIVCDKIGIPHQKLPHKIKTKHRHYTEYYDDETRQIVAERFARDIEYFGYKFGE